MARWLEVLGSTVPFLKPGPTLSVLVMLVLATRRECRRFLAQEG